MMQAADHPLPPYGDDAEALSEMPKNSSEGQEVAHLLKMPQIEDQHINWDLPTDAQAAKYVKDHDGASSWQYRVLKFLHKPKVQIVLASLLLLDVLILITEMALLTFFPPCNMVERDGISCCPADGDHEDGHDDHHRFLGGAGGGHDICGYGLKETDYDAGCDSHKYETVHQVEFGLFILTIFILSVFFVELCVTMVALKPQVFFRQMFYTADFVIVTASLALELTFKLLGDDMLASLMGLVILVRLWRFVRIGHGIVEVTNEIAHQREEKLIVYMEELEDLLKANGITIPEGLVRPIDDHHSSHHDDDILAHLHKHHIEKQKRKNQSLRSQPSETNASSEGES